MSDTKYGIRLQDYNTLEWSWSTTDGVRDVWTDQEFAERQAAVARNVDQLNDARVEPITD
jgi:hypothetical protein